MKKDGTLIFVLFDKKSSLYTGEILKSTNYMVKTVRSSHGDEQIRYRVELMEMLRAFDGMVVITLHDLNLAARYCDSLVLLDRGAVVASGSMDDVLQPHVLEPVYGIRMQRLAAEDGCPQLLFRSLRQPHPATHRHSDGTPVAAPTR